MFTYDDNLFSDLHKDAYGFRPRSHEYWDATPEEKQKIWDYTIRDLDEAIRIEKEQEVLAVETFNELIQSTIAFGAGDVDNALRWLTQNEKFYNIQCVEHWVWNHGILFTDYGRDICQRLEKLVTYED